ncbi:50S ribosomal protein L31 [Candidatus Dependentiae bacterium]
MKKDLHPKSYDVTVKCVCGNNFKTTSTVADFDVDICSACHPFFTGTQKFVDTAGRIEKFQKKYATKNKAKK